MFRQVLVMTSRHHKEACRCAFDSLASPLFFEHSSVTHTFQAKFLEVEAGIFRIYFRGHKGNQGRIGQNLSGVFLSDTRLVVGRGVHEESAEVSLNHVNGTRPWQK